MDIRLSWDLFVIVFFIVIVAYSFIIGRNSTLKVIVGTYISALAADAIGNLFGQYFSGSAFFLKLLKLAAVNNEDQAVIFAKVTVFVLLVILFAVKGAFSVQTTDDRSPSIRLVMSMVYAFLSAGLIISAMLVFVSGVSFIGGSSPETTTTALWDVYNKSSLIRSMVQNSYLWFSAPAVAFLLHSLYSEKDE